LSGENSGNLGNVGLNAKNSLMNSVEWFSCSRFQAIVRAYWPLGQLSSQPLTVSLSTSPSLTHSVVTHSQH